MENVKNIILDFSDCSDWTEDNTEETEVLNCADCGNEIDSEDFTNDNDEAICERCSQDYYVCEDCGNIHHGDDMNWLERYEIHVCQDCADSNYYYCEVCDELHSPSDNWVSNGDHCICENCAENFGTCEDCGSIQNYDDLIWNEHNEQYYCEDCYSSNSIIHEAHDDIDLTFHGEGKRHYGWECEVNTPNWSTDRMMLANDLYQRQYDEYFMKEDGSIGNGIEIVSHPMTLDYMMTEFNMERIFQSVRRFGFQDGRSCGLHVHVSREGLGDDKNIQDLTIAKMMILFDKFWNSHILPFSRRDEDRLNQWSRRPSETILPHEDEEEAIEKVNKEYRHYDRYRAINLQNRQTVEIRIFASTVDHQDILASVQWLDTLIDYCMETPIENIHKSTWSTIFDKPTYSELSVYMNRLWATGDLI